MLSPFARLVPIAIILTCSCALYSQVGFVQSDEYISTEGYRSGITTSIVDINNDGRDDIVRVTSRGILELHLASSNYKKLYKIEYEASLPDIPWSITVGNLDNKGPNEIALGTVYRGGFIFELNQRNERLELSQLTARDFYSQGANFVDINNDGYIDWFVNDDESTNEIFLNDGSGKVVEADDFIDLSTAVPSDNSGNYSTDWVDIDDDGDLDFYLSKCRSGALSYSDPRRINQLFINDGNNNYTDQAEDFGLAFGTQTWASNFGDMDNDGDLDVIIINHIDKWNLLENVRNDTFVERNNRIDSTGGFANQCLLRDFDNNGYLDILVTGVNDYIWFNQGGWKFELDRKPFLYFNATNFSVGDINHDGFYDIYASFSEGFNDPGLVDDALYLNRTNDNNWIGFSLVGTESNKSGIGAKIKIFSESIGSQMRNIRSGESYGMMNSLNTIFGLGEDTVIDSMKVYWPSGNIDTYNDIEAGSYYTITEKTCIEEEQELAIENSGIICKDNSVSLSAPDGSDYLWSNKEVGQSLKTDRWGYYSVEMESDGCKMPIAGAVLKPQNDNLFRSFITKLDEESCAGETIRLASIAAKTYKWSNGDTSQITTVNYPDTYTVEVEDHCGNTYTDEILVNYVDPRPATQGDTVVLLPDVSPENAKLVGVGSNVKWYLSPEDDKAIFEGDTLVVPNLEQTKTFYVSGEKTQRYSDETNGEKRWVGTNKYSSETLNGGLFFQVNEACTIESIDVMTDSAGVRIIQILNEAKDLLFEKTFDLRPGDTTLILDFQLDIGIDYFITTSKEQNLESFGFKGPQLIRNNQKTRYPYKDSDLIWITNSSFGESYYLYFYNWKIKKHDLVCVSERIPVTAFVDIRDATIEAEINQFKIYPNPTNNLISIESQEGKLLTSLFVYDALGREVLIKTQLRNDNLNLDVSALMAGQYFMRLQTNDYQSYSYRFIKH